MKVIIADDSALLRGRLISILSEFEGVEIIDEVRQAARALESIRKHKPDVVILDIRMPGGNGIDVLKALKKVKIRSITIMFTNYPSPRYREKCLKCGADYFFDKAGELDGLVDVFKRLIIKKAKAGAKAKDSGGKISRIK